MAVQRFSSILHTYMKRLFAASLSCILFLFSCHSTKRVVLPPVAVSAHKSTMEIYRGSAPMVWDITHETVALSFNLKEKTSDGKALIVLHPYFYATDSLQLDAKSMRIDSVILKETSGNKTLPFTYADDIITIRFNRKYTRNDYLNLYIVYKAMPYASKEQGGSAAISDDRGLYFINTDNSIPGKPVQVWTQGETESNSHWMPTIDKPNERLRLQLELTVPDSFVTLGNGYLAPKQQKSNGMRTDIWVMDNPIQVYAAMFAIGKFAIVKDEPWRDREVSYYVEPAYAPYAKTMFANTKEMMDFFSDITGVLYPWDKYSQVVVRDYVSGAMENTSASLFGEFMNQNNREHADEDFENIVAHELFHQWFGDYVTAESWSNVTLNESFANYGEQLWRYHRYGKASADVLAIQDMWKYVYGQSKTNDPALVRYYYNDREDVFDRISYEKGGAVLNYLHALIGDEAFFKAMNLYLKRNALQSAEVSQWRTIIEEVTGQDWNWFFNQWYMRGGHPVLDVKYNYDEATRELQVNVTQSQKEVYRLPVQTWLMYGDKPELTETIIDEKTKTFTYPYRNGIKPVVLIDAGHWVVGEINYNMKPWQWLAVFKQSGDNIVNKMLGVGDARRNVEDTAAQSIINLALQDKEADIRRLVLENLGNLNAKQWQDKWKTNVSYLATNDGNNKVRAAAFDLLRKWKVTTARQDMYEALADSSYMVAGAALEALAVIQKDTAYLLAKKMLKTDPRGELRATCWDILAERGNAADVDLFEKESYNVYGRSKIDFAQSLSVYMKNVKDEKVLDKALSAYNTLIKTENIRSYRGAIGTYLFDVARDEKDRIKEARSNPEQQEEMRRLDKIKAAINEMVKEETDEDNKKQYDRYMNMVF